MIFLKSNERKLQFLINPRENKVQLLDTTFFLIWNRLHYSYFELLSRDGRHRRMAKLSGAGARVLFPASHLPRIVGADTGPTVQ